MRRGGSVTVRVRDGAGDRADGRGVRFRFARVNNLGGTIRVTLGACLLGASFLVALAVRVMRGAGDATLLAVRTVRRVGGGVLFDDLFVVVVGVQVGGVDGVGAVQAGAINLHGINLYCLHAGGGSLCGATCCSTSFGGTGFCRCRLGITSLRGILSGGFRCGSFRCNSFRARRRTHRAVPRNIARGIPRGIGCCAVLYRVVCLVLFCLIHSVNDTPRRCVCVSISLHCDLVL